MLSTWQQTPYRHENITPQQQQQKLTMKIS